MSVRSFAVFIICAAWLPRLLHSLTVSNIKPRFSGHGGIVAMTSADYGNEHGLARGRAGDVLGLNGVTHERKAANATGAVGRNDRGFPDMKSRSRSRGSSRQKSAENLVKGTNFVMIPELKLLFCTIPKNGCTQWHKFFSALSEPTPYQELAWSNESEVNDVFSDPTWTKAVFLRDPLERLVSGFQSKCEVPLEGDGRNCMNFPETSSEWQPSFDEFAKELNHCHNPHFDPQTSFCLLDTRLEQFSFVGKVSKNFSAVSDQVNAMLDQSIERSGAQPSDERRQELAQLSAACFPPEGLTKGNMDHIHMDTVVTDFYKNETTLLSSLEHYAIDYERLNLEVPPGVPPELFGTASGNAALAAAAAANRLPGEKDPWHDCRSKSAPSSLHVSLAKWLLPFLLVLGHATIEGPRSPLKDLVH
eukprot:TRINITY_DN4869_c0_g1_i2.p1 TRINITY_DN4869_c0_g1~~TRINITY_DN4869_c0_g1_i2.p1  ORF type:complete len:418 (-),score=67.25 TRINITY_DN4869_c0_g1_i2:69-1322(-)